MSAEWYPLRGHRNHMGPGYNQAAGRLDAGNWAHGAWESLAATLAAPLRKALHDHYKACTVCPERGIFHCPEGKRLWDLQPEGDKIVFA